MKNISSIDTGKFYLGSLCRRKHDYENTGHSLRTIKKSECLECRRLRRKAKGKLKGSYLGRLCKRNHEYQNTNSSLRRRSTGACIECHKLSSAGNKKSPHYCPDYFKYRTWLKNPRISLTVFQLVENEAARIHQLNRYKWDKEYRERRKAQYRNKYAQHSESEKQRIFEWKQNNSDLVSEQQRRRRKRLVSASDGSVTSDLMEKMKNEAKACCYCDCQLSNENKTIDHANPIGLGGLHSIKNIVVCCDKCNYRKGDMPLFEWLNLIFLDLFKNS